MTTFYNEWDKKTAAWLWELGKQGLVTNGVVDERSIKELRGEDLRGYRRVHLFAGIGGWDYALRLAGWPDDRPVWTGSCPCQPFSSAGNRKGQNDDRHLWPDMFRLIRECRPDTIFGEQVASAIGHGWLDGVFADLEGIGYTCGAVVLGAHSVGAPHMRQRLWWVADATSRRCGQTLSGDAPNNAGRSCSIGGLADAKRWSTERWATFGTESGKAGSVASEARERQRCWTDVASNGSNCSMADAESLRARSREQGEQGSAESGRNRSAIGGEGCGLGITTSERSQGISEAGATGGATERACVDGGVGHSERERCERHGDAGAHGTAESNRTHADATERAGPWSGSAFIACGDGKTRRIEPGISPLVDGIPARVVRLRGYGNAIVPQVAAAFVRAFMESQQEAA